MDRSELQELTTDQVADVLHVSRSFVVALLEQGKIPHRMEGGHPRVRIADLLEFKKRDDAERETALAELAAEAQKHGLGY